MILLITSFSSLVYEVVWGRELSFTFGTSAFAITTVLATFMAGLALGSLCGGRMIDKVEKKYNFLAFVEILIGLSCLATLFMLDQVRHPYFYIYNLFSGNLLLFNSALFALSFMILIVPTFLIGIIFPTIGKLYYSELKSMGKSVGTAYMFDTIGGAVGALLTGFILIAVFGLFYVSLMASVLNILFGIICLIAFRGDSIALAKSLPESEAKENAPISQDNIILVLFFLSGFAALMFEVIWTRYIALIYGSSTQSFATVLASFLAGLGIGSIIASKYADKIRNKFTALAFIELMIGTAGMLLVIAFPAMERWFLYIYFHTSLYFLFMLLLFLVCFAIILIPTMLMGTTLPLLSAAYISADKSGTDLGKLYSVNSFGSIFGAFISGFIIIPLIGLTYSSILAGAIYIIIAIALLYRFTDDLSRKRKKDAMMLCTAIILLSSISLISYCQPDYLYNGVYYQGVRYSNESGIFQDNSGDNTQLLFEANSPYGVVTVFRDRINVWLKNNGKTDASLIDMDTQGLLSYLPISLHSSPKRVLNIGMGGAFSLSSILTFNEVESVDVVEIDPEVVEACKTVLADYNNHCLNDSRTNVIVADGRNFLFSTDKKYDVIISEPPNIWVSGVSNLFTKEFYEMARAHLGVGGIFSQWFPRYEMDEHDYMIAIKTLRSVFPYVYEFDLGGDKIVLASTKDYDIYRDLNKSRLSSRKVDEDFNTTIKYSGKEYRFTYDNYDHYDPGKRNYDFLVSYYRRGPAEIDKYVQDVNEINTDNLPVLEFSTERDKYPKFRINQS